VTLRQRIRFYQQLAVLVRAGLPLRNAFTRLGERLKSREVALLAQKIGDGDRVAEAFTAARFSAFECQLVAAGERSAHFETIFDHLADFWQRELEMRQALLRPLLYPIIVLHLAVVLDSGLELVTLSWPVVLVHLIVRLVFFYAAGIAIYFLVGATWNSHGMRFFWMRVPIVGGALRAAFAYRWITALRMEFIAGISLYRAVGDAWRASDYPGGEQRAVEAEQAMLGGAQLSKLITGWRQLPRDWIDFVETGELSGNFEAAFVNLEAESSRNWKLAQQRMTEWVPKIAYFVVLIFVAAQVGLLVYKVTVQPIVDAEQQIDNAVNGK
jgi:type II secretory pathway component PulF